tara:strand:- start:2533 stop:3681 length:1149 start_codon:yes stop_codon:yes gene_type:complete
MYKIPLSEPSFKGNEWKYVKECLDDGWVSSAGKYVNLFEEKISNYTKSKYSVACVNGTAALQIALKLVGVRYDDEVIAPTLTFIAPINAISYCNAKPVFMDCDNYYNIDTEKIINFINEETVFKNGFTFNKRTNKRIKAIVFVHVWGNACTFNSIIDLCRNRNISIVEDSSESLGTFYKNRHNGNHTGLIGDIGCISFNGNKIITTGGGGMLVTNNSSFAEKAKYLTTQAKDDPIYYRHDEVGYNFRLTNIQAALGVAQLEQLPYTLKRKKEIYNFYNDNINQIDGLSLAGVPKYANNNHWLNLLQISNSNSNSRDLLMSKLDKNGIISRPVWMLNHLQTPYKNCESYKIENAKKLVTNSLCLPSSSTLHEEHMNQIIEQLK